MVTGAAFALRGNEDSDRDLGKALTLIGGIPTAGLALWDIFGAASSAREAQTHLVRSPSGSDITLECFLTSE
jgi:hypothetical protein